MKRNTELLFILLILTFSSFFSFKNIMFISAVDATYVEGFIVQDSIWTLVDSPFVISNETIICENATLTIEPGVEVRFGGHFSITVEGTLVTEGTEDKIIKFTSNELQPQAGSWGSIRFDSTQPSSLKFCTIEYGVNGIIVENGYVNIQDSIMQFNFESGIKVLNGDVTIENSAVVNNTMSGIYIVGGQVIIQENVINLNEDGIVLTGNLTSEISISHNEISLNKHSGILYETNTHESIITRDNTFSKNFYALYISTNNATQITRNYILNNSVGIFYEKGTEHTANFNDIYNNGLGMDVLFEASVDATCNYWGDKSGPYHESLNPRGKGNPVGGDGENLDFIFFLTHPIDYANSNPTAVLWTDKLLVAPNHNVTFIGTDSYDDGQVNQYLFDFGDGANSDWTTLSLFTHSYDSTGAYTASLMVMDDFKTTSPNAFVDINVVDLPPLSASITLGNYTVAHNEEVLVTVYVSDGANAVGNANVKLFSVKGGNSTFMSGLTNSSGYFTTTFKAPDVTEVTDVRIIARASKEAYADGSDYKYLKVLPPLTVYVTADPNVIISETTSLITTHVTYDFAPISNATVAISSDMGGNFSKISETTNLDGDAVFLFTAPQVTIKDGLNATITVTATKTGYVSGENYTLITIESKLLYVQITAEPNATVSEGKMNVKVQVTYDESPVEEANVTLISEAGVSLPTFKLSDYDGIATFLFTATPVDAPRNVTLQVIATKNGYATGENSLNITVNPGKLNVEITVNPSSPVMSGELVILTVYVSCEQAPVANAMVSVTYSVEIPFTTNLTDSGGHRTFVFNAPQTTTQLPVDIIVNATKYGYESGEKQISITVNPGVEKPAEGWPLTIILLTLIPIIIAIVIVVLIKLKIIIFSFKGEEE